MFIIYIYIYISSCPPTWNLTEGPFKRDMVQTRTPLSGSLFIDGRVYRYSTYIYIYTYTMNSYIYIAKILFLAVKLRWQDHLQTWNFKRGLAVDTFSFRIGSLEAHPLLGQSEGLHHGHGELLPAASAATDWAVSSGSRLSKAPGGHG